MRIHSRFANVTKEIHELEDTAIEAIQNKAQSQQRKNTEQCVNELLKNIKQPSMSVIGVFERKKNENWSKENYLKKQCPRSSQ